MIAKFLRHTAAAFLFVSAATASAQEYIPPGADYVIPDWKWWALFDFTEGGPSSNGVGNYAQYSETSEAGHVFNLRVTAWSLQKACSTCEYKIQPARLAAYDGGLGVLAADDGTGADNQHTVDNEGGKDFLLFQFNRDVTLVGALFNTYSVEGTRKDSDISVYYGNVYATQPNPTNTTLSSLNGLTVNQLNSLFTNTYKGGYYDDNVTTQNSNWRYINQDNHWGDTWIIGATFTNEDYTYVEGKKVKKSFDGFKLAALAVVPEPQTWAMMIAGFGLIGGVMRSRRRVELASA